MIGHSFDASIPGGFSAPENLPISSCARAVPPAPVTHGRPENPCMYAAFFGLRELPFNNTPDPRFFFSTPDHEEALASLIYAVQERKGFVLLTGEVGTGKTLVSRMMLKHFGGQIVFAHIHHSVDTADDLLESIAVEFELPAPRGNSRTQRVRSLHDFLLRQFAQNIPIVLVLDEAQNLSAEAFEQLRMIGNLEADDAKLLQVVIVGQPELKTLFASAGLRQLRQRIFRSFHLPALDRPACEAYIRHRLAVAGGGGSDIFKASAFDVIHDHSQGLPRIMNTICDNAMLSAYGADRPTIDGPFVKSVIAQMVSIDPDEETVETSRLGDGMPQTVKERSFLPLPLFKAEGDQGRSPKGRVGESPTHPRFVRFTTLKAHLRDSIHRDPGTARLGVGDQPLVRRAAEIEARLRSLARSPALGGRRSSRFRASVAPPVTRPTLASLLAMRSEPVTQRNERGAAADLYLRLQRLQQQFLNPRAKTFEAEPALTSEDSDLRAAFLDTLTANQFIRGPV
jgi:general secretion pathway protein A